jgi:hypothetical protein
MRALVAAAAGILALALAPAALADGDPASDYLISQSVFLPFDVHVDKDRAAGLTALLAASKKAGFPIRVAVIATKTDLGAVPVLYGQPVRYAQFLGQELFYFYKHNLLVVMPNGYGVYAGGPSPAGDRDAVAKLPAPGTADGNALVAAADRAVRTLASRRGITLPQAAVTSTGGSSNRDRFVILGAAVIAVALVGGVLFVLRRRSRRSRT